MVTQFRFPIRFKYPWLIRAEPVPADTPTEELVCPSENEPIHESLSDSLAVMRVMAKNVRDAQWLLTTSMNQINLQLVQLEKAVRELSQLADRSEAAGVTPFSRVSRPCNEPSNPPRGESKP